MNLISHIKHEKILPEKIKSLKIHLQKKKATFQKLNKKSK
jgi:hypothetical protein